ncbi:MAG: hypothetical protein OEM32_11295 [Acidimicrobiia bacterium]|nr:hypothetical protein [Acidimicrobiia bacterium]
MLDGFPTPSALEAAQRGLIALGGCVLPLEMFSWWCEEDQMGWYGTDSDDAFAAAMEEVEPFVDRG